MSSRAQTAKPASKRTTSPAAAKPATSSISTKSPSGLLAVRTVRKASLRAKAGLFVTWHKMDFATKISAIRKGVPAQAVGELSSFMDIPKDTLMDSLGLPRATINRKVKLQQALSRDESERVMGVQALIGQVQAMIDVDSAPDFDAAKWLARWLADPLPALGGATPASYMDTVEGQKYVGNLLAMIQSGAYA